MADREQYFSEYCKTQTIDTPNANSLKDSNIWPELGHLQAVYHRNNEKHILLSEWFEGKIRVTKIPVQKDTTNFGSSEKLFHCALDGSGAI